MFWSALRVWGERALATGQDLDNRNRQLGVLRLTDATIAQSFSKN